MRSMAESGWDTAGAWRARLGTPVLRALAVLFLAVVLVACDSVEERAQNHYESGMELLDGGEDAKASLEFRNAIKLNDSHVQANLELGRLYEKTNNFSAAVFQYRKVVALDAAVLDAHLRLGQLMLAFNEVGEAVKASVAAAQLAAGQPDVLVLEAAVALRVQDFEKARAKAEQALAADEDFGDAWIMLAAVSRLEENQDTSLEQVNEALARDPNNKKAALFRLNLLGEMGRTDEVGEALGDLVSRNPQELAFWEALARWQIASRKFDEAETSLRRMRELAPENVDRSLDLVRLIGRVAGRDAAIVEIKKLIDEAPNVEVKSTLEIALSEIEIQNGNIDGAAERLAELVDTLEKGTAELATARIRLARLKLAQDNRDEAHKLIDETLEEDSTNSDALTLRGRIKILDEDYDGAIRDLRAAEAEEPDQLETVELLALAHQRNGSSDLARERLAAAVQISDYAPNTVLKNARFLVQEGKSEFAVESLEEALKRNSGDVRLLNMLARLKISLKQFPEAERIARQLQADPATSDTGDQLMASIFAGQQRYDETIDILETAYSREEGGEAFLGPLVATHLRNDDMESARQAVDNALRKDPENADAIRIKGTLAMIESDGPAALALFEQAISLAPERPVNHLALFRFHTSQSDPDKATAALQAGIETTDSPLLRLNLAMVHERDGDLEAAIAQYQEVYDKQPGSMMVANNLASLISDTNPTEADIERAYRIARRLRDSNVPHFLDTYGWLLYLRGDYGEAVRVLEQSARALSNNPLAQAHYGIALASSGDRELARTVLERAMELAGDRVMPQLDPAKRKLAELSSGD